MLLSYRRNIRAFTLIEILVVVAIIGLLSILILVALNSAKNSSKDVRVLRDLNQIKTQLEIGYSNGIYQSLTASSNYSASLVGGTSNYANIVSLACDTGVQNGYAVVANGISLTCAGALRSTGIVIYTAQTSDPIVGYAIYADSIAGYYCLSSTGTASKNSSGGAIPLYSASGVIANGTANCI